MSSIEITINSADEDMLTAIAAQQDELIGRAIKWANISSGSTNVTGLEETQNALYSTLRLLNGDVSRHSLLPSTQIASDGTAQQQHHPATLKLVARPKAQTQIILTGHYDTVFPLTTSFLRVQSRADGALNGPGIADMKGGISVMLGALEAFERHPAAGNIGYTVVLSPDEEIGSPASAAILAESAQTAHLGMTFEPALPSGALVDSRKGSGNFHIVIQGRAAHAGRDFAAGRNAVAAAAALATALAALNGQRGGLTLNIAQIEGGGALNTVPALAVLRFNVRVIDQDSAEWVQHKIADAVTGIAIEHDVIITQHGGMTRAPKPRNDAQSALIAAVTAVGKALGEAITWAPSGGVCEGNNLFASGVPNIDTLGVRGGDIHSEREFAWPDSFVPCAQRAALILAKIADGTINAHAIQQLMRTN